MYSSVYKSLDFFRILTFIILSFAFLALQVHADLAPKEDEEEEAANVVKSDVREEIIIGSTTTTSPSTNLGFIHAFIASFSVIIVSEIGDKTFFIAAIMSMVR